LSVVGLSRIPLSSKTNIKVQQIRYDGE